VAALAKLPRQQRVGSRERTVEETASDAADRIAQAKAVCGRCPVRLLCRIHADETGGYGVYAGETHTERTRRLRRWQRLELPA